MESLNLENSVISIEPTDTGRRAYLVLLGCSLLQFPVWGFAVSYGVLQEYYASSLKLPGNIRTTGIIGTTLNGIIYLSMPFLFGLFTNRYSHLRKYWSIIGIILSVGSLILSSIATKIWHLVITQGILLAIGNTILYSSTTIYLDEWFVRRKGFAFGVMLSTKSAVGAAGPILLGYLLSKLGFRMALRIWSIMIFATAVPAIIFLQPRRPTSREARRSRRLSWSFLHHSTFYIFSIANIIFAASYGMPQTYLPSFAAKIHQFSTSSSALMLAALNIPSIFACFWFGLLADGNAAFAGYSLSIWNVSLLSALGSSIPTFILWGMVPGESAAGIVVMVLFAVIYGFFAGGYSSTWGGVVKEIKKEAESYNEAIDTSLIFGLLNGGRGIGFVAGGLSGIELLKIGAIDSSHFAYGTDYGSLILFTGIGAAIGGSSILWKRF